MSATVDPSPSAASWEGRVRALAAFRQARGRWPVPTARDPEEARLGWVLHHLRRSMRNRSGAPRMPPARRRFVEALLPEWDITNYASLKPADVDGRWGRNARAVGTFHRAHGRWPSKTAADAEERRLGNWLHLQRRAARNEPDWFDETGRRAYLDEVAPWWQGLNKETRWLLSAYELQRIIERDGRWPTAKARDAPHAQLGAWLVKRRAEHREGTLSPDRVAQLDRILPGWRDPDRDRQWHEALRACVAYAAAHGGTLPKAGTRGGDGIDLGLWLRRQRRAARQGMLDAERRETLDSELPSWQGDDREAVWEAYLENVVAYADAHDGQLPLSRHVDPQGRRLGNWVHHQREAEKTGKLSTERRAKLDAALPSWRDGHEARWERGLADAVAYAEAHGGRIAPTRYVDPQGCRPGDWVHRQRMAENAGTLTDKRRAKLDAALPNWRSTRR